MEREMEKEQRRRKIIARGTDRMALITGRINTLDPDPMSKCCSFSVNRPDLPPPLHARSTSEPLSAHSSHKNCINLLGPFTAQAINFTLLSSEEIRAICSVALGLLVVLSRFIFHHTAAFKPLYVLLLTDLLIVAARLLPYARTRKDEDDDDDSLEGAVKLLELGLVLHQMSSAIFIDCSFYLVVVILGVRFFDTIFFFFLSC